MPDSLFEVIADTQAILDEAQQRLGDTKIESLPRMIAKLSKLTGDYPTINLAVELCCRMYQRAVQEAIETGSSRSSAHQIGCLSYRSCMPKLDGRDNIRDFVACVAHGMCASIIPGAEGTRLLYAAQVAYSAHPPRKRHKKRAKTPQMRTQTPQTTPNASTT
jgi:hypothetical protein